MNMPPLADTSVAGWEVPAAAPQIAIWHSKIAIKIRIKTRTTTTKQ